MRSLLLSFLLLLPALVQAAPPPTPRRLSVIMVPMDKAAEASVLKVETYANEVLKEYEGVQLKTSDDLFPVADDVESAASLKRAELGFSESQAAFKARNFDDAERKLRATIKEFGRAVAAMDTCGHLCDAVAMYAAALQARGDAEEAKIAVLDLLALNATMDLDRKLYPQSFLALKAQVATSRNAQLRGNLLLQPKPAGARIFVDGKFQGYSPLTVATLPIGKHLLRIERPGFREFGQLVEVTPEDLVVDPDLVPTEGYKAFDTLLDRLASEAMRDKGGATMTSVARTLAVDRAVVGVLKVLEDGATELLLGYFDLKTGKRLASKRATFQGDEFGQLKGELGRMVNSLVNSGHAGAGKVSRSGDPLDNTSGTEDWASDDRGGRSQSKEKKRRGNKDPLDSRSGTEDW